MLCAEFNENNGILDSPHAARTPEGAFEATTQARQEIGFRKVKDNNSPVGFTMQSYPTSAAKFQFNNPDVVAYKIEIEYEGLTAEHVFNPFVSHYESSDRYSMSDFIGPLRETYRLRTQERIDSITNPADRQQGMGSDIMQDLQNLMNQWENR